MDRNLFWELLSQKANECGISLTMIQGEQFYRYMQLLLEWNQKINLTAITQPEEIVLKHFIDSLVVGRYIEERNRILDIGTGAGFPGIPLAILFPNKSFVLADSLNKRIQFLEVVKEEVSLKNVEMVHGRAEELAQNSSFREQFDVVTSRAVARLNVLLEYMLPYLKKDGICICMKGPNMEEELKEAKKAIFILGGILQKTENLILPSSDIVRNLIFIKKEKQTPKKYPRKAGTPAKDPIL